jgi:hypothetical protein
MSSNAKIFFRNYGNFDLSSIMDPEMLKDSTLPFSSNTSADWSMTNDSTLQSCTIPAVPDDTSYKIKPALLSNRNKELFRDLQTEGKELGRVSYILPGLSQEYSDVRVGKKMLNVGNACAWVEIALKFNK